MFNKKTHVHFMGIGGIGMSGIAKVLKERGYTVSGCDLDMDQKSIKQLQEVGCPIAGTHSSTLCHDASIDVLVYSAAVNLNHPEVLHARRRGIPVVARAHMLAELMRTSYGIAVAGAHGKTTTTSMISHILMQAQYDPTLVIGGFLKNIGTNARAGTGLFLVAEADESDRSLVHLPATFAVVTNIDREHLDTYKDLDDVIDTFKQFLDRLPFYGKAIVCADDAAVGAMLPSIPHINTITYGIQTPADFQARDIITTAQNSQCIIYHHETLLGSVEVPVAGTHNILNALAAIAVSMQTGVAFEQAAAALATFAGVERRFCYHGLYKGAELFDDYAHHPQEIANALAVAKQRAKGRLIVIFQPHRFTRTYHLWNDFIQTFLASHIDELIITDIFSASEPPIDGVSSQLLIENMTQQAPSFNARYIPLDSEFDAIINHLNSTVQPDDLVLMLGAGKVFKIPDKLIG